MKRIIVFVFCLLWTFFSCGCIRSMFADADALKTIYTDHSELFLLVAEEAISYGESTFISTYEYSRPDGVDDSLSGLYVHDTVSGVTSELKSENIEKLFSECSVRSLGVKVEDGIEVCEFNMEGGRQYYNGVYYVNTNEPIFLSNFAVPLTPDGDGYSHSVENMNFYTEQWGECFFYFVAKAL